MKCRKTAQDETCEYGRYCWDNYQGDCDRTTTKEFELCEMFQLLTLADVKRSENTRPPEVR